MISKDKSDGAAASGNHVNYTRGSIWSVLDSKSYVFVLLLT